MSVPAAIREPPTAPARRAMLETCGRLREAWYAAALASELKPRRPLGRTILETPLVLWRARDGSAVALEDRCAHRNAPLSEGVVLGGVLACPYHGWSYDEGGRCAGVPSRGPSAPPPDCGVPRFPVLERHGLVWVWMGAREPDAEPFPMPHWAEPGWGTYYMVTPFANEVTHLVENFMDVPHTTFVHAGWFRRPAHREVRVVVERTPRGVRVEYDLPEDRIGFTGRILNPKGAPTTHTDAFHMPNTTRVDYGFGPDRGFAITSTCTPRAPFDTLVYTLISYRLGWLNRTAPLWLPWYTRRVIRQDVEIMRLQGDNLRRFDAPRFHSTAADLLHEHVEALRDHAGSGEDGPAPGPRRDEVRFWI